LEFYYAGKQRQLYSDEKGRPLDSLARAKYLREDILFEIKNGTFSIKKYTKVKAIRTAVLLDQFLTEKLKEIAPSYVSNYKSFVNAAKVFFGAKNIREIAKEDLILYKTHLESTKKNLKPITIKHYVAHFLVFLDWCRDRDLVQVVPALPKIECMEPETKWLGKDDQQRILEVVREPDKPIITFSMFHGLRPGETRALKVKDVDLNNRSINVHATFSADVYRPRRKGRGAKAVTIPIHPASWEYIQQRVKSSTPDAWLFPNPTTGDKYNDERWNKTWKLIKDKLGLGRITPYQMTRHSYASQLGAAGVPVQIIKGLLGHSEIQTTMKYTHPDLESMRTAIDKLTYKDKVVEMKKEDKNEK
jgi:integrase